MLHFLVYFALICLITETDRNEPKWAKMNRNRATNYRNGYNKYQNGAYNYRNGHDKYRNSAFNYRNGAITYQNGAIYLYKDEYSIGKEKVRLTHTYEYDKQQVHI